MYAGEDILRFLDGSITGEEEAELLHRLSVSPERRDKLRSYMKQQEFIDRDRNAITVPYAAEQKLWATLNTMMPVAETVATSAVVTQVATKPRAIGWVAMGAVAVMSLLVGFGSGFFAGKESSEVTLAPRSEVILQAPLAASNSNAGFENTNTIENATNRVRTTQAHNNTRSEAPLNTSNRNGNVSDIREEEKSTTVVDNEVAQLQTVSNVHTLRESDNVASAITISESLGGMEKSPFNRESFSERSFLQRWEFAITENFGKQYPDNGATIVSFPVVTNSSLGVYFQPFEKTNLWVGAGVGSMNISKEHLAIKETPGVGGDKHIGTSLSHVQTEWFGGSLQYRFPVFSSFNITTSLGLSGSAEGVMASAELGTRFDVTSQVGISLGMRLTNLSYDLQNEKNEMIQNGVDLDGLGWSKSLDATFNSQNVDAVLGIYFHF
jgi:hypothetical protein